SPIPPHPPPSTLFPYTTLFRSRNYRCSNQKLVQLLGFRPRRTVLESIDNMVQRFSAEKAMNFSHPRYYNIDWMVLLGEVHAEHQDRKSTRLNSSHVAISYAVFC